MKDIHEKPTMNIMPHEESLKAFSVLSPVRKECLLLNLAPKFYPEQLKQRKGIQIGNKEVRRPSLLAGDMIHAKKLPRNAGKKAI